MLVSQPGFLRALVAVASGGVHGPQSQALVRVGFRLLGRRRERVRQPAESATRDETSKNEGDAGRGEHHECDGLYRDGRPRYSAQTRSGRRGNRQPQYGVRRHENPDHGRDDGDEALGTLIHAIHRRLN